jgi:nucleotide-binding universal stress UspA family protein
MEQPSETSQLTIKYQMLSLDINSILFPSDFSTESYAIFETVKAFAETFNAKVHLLRVVTTETNKKTEKINNRMNLFIDHFQLDEEKIEIAIYKDKTRELGVLNYSIDNDIDMIAIGSHGKGIVRKLVKESISQDLVKNTFKPILTIRF